MTAVHLLPRNRPCSRTLHRSKVRNHAMPSSGSTSCESTREVAVFALGHQTNTKGSHLPVFVQELTSLPRHPTPGFSSKKRPPQTQMIFPRKQPWCVGTVSTCASTYCAEVAILRSGFERIHFESLFREGIKTTNLHSSDISVVSDFLFFARSQKTLPARADIPRRLCNKAGASTKAHDVI